MSRFDLEKALAGKNPIFGKVPDSGTREQIEYIDLSMIDSDPNNFYELSGIDELASNIALCGLQQPIRVRTGTGGRVTIVSGHRRRAAIELLVKEGRKDLQQVPCIRQRENVSPALQKLQLIYANSDTRRMTSAEISKQAEEVETLLYQLQEEGIEFPGRMRDHVAKVCQISKTKLSNLKVIRENLTPKWKEAWEKGEVNESVALTIARMPEEHQSLCWESAKNKTKLSWYYEGEAEREGKLLASLDKVKCPTGMPCHHKTEKFRCARQHHWKACQNRCCEKCADLGTCKHACPVFAERIKQIKADRREANRQEKLAQEEREKPIIDAIREMWRRFGEARRAAGVTVEQYHKAAGIYHSRSDEEKVKKLESGEAKFTVSTDLPYGYSFYRHDAERLQRIADTLGVSLDYLFLRSADPVPCYRTQDEFVEWADGARELPVESGLYWCITGPMSGGGKLYWWNGEEGCWEHSGAHVKLTPDIKAWMRCPELPEGIAWTREGAE